MDKTKSNRIYNILLVLCSSVFLLYFYGPVLFSPNDFLFTTYGDGFSQYFNFTYYIKHNPGYFDFTGTNYPYGEHYFFSDGQPFFAAFLKTLYGVFPFIGDYTIGILNFFALFSLWATPLLLFSILRRTGVHPLLGIFGAIGITALEPQVFRMLSHFSLSYSCAIPLTLYLMMRVAEQKRVALWGLLLMLSNTIWIFTHPYLGLMCCLLTGSVWFFHSLWNFKKLLKSIKNYIFPLLTVLLPVLVFQTVVKLTDTHTDKSGNVYGIFTFCGEPDDVFIPNHPPLKPVVDSMLNSPFEQNWEGWSYVGLTTILTFLLAALVWLFMKIRRKPTSSAKSVQPLVWIAFCASVPLLFLSWALPFRFFPDMLDYVTIIKQFRSLGRFAWPFYYVSTICSIYLINIAFHYLESKNQKILAFLIIIPGPLLYCIEGYEPHREVSTTISGCSNLFSEEFRPEIYKKGFAEIDPDKYQAILPLPYFYQGSGNFFKRPKGGSMHMAMLSSAYLGLPTMSAICARGDVWESRNLLQIISAPFYNKKIAADMPSDKPVLIARSNKYEPVSHWEQWILDRSRFIVSDEDGHSFYELKINDLFDNQCNNILKEFEERRPSLFKKNGWLLQDSTAYIVHEDFDSLESIHTFRGAGAFDCPKTGSHMIKEFATSPENEFSDQEYHMRVWVYNGEMDVMNYVFFVTKGFDGTALHDLNVSRPDEATTINGDWSLIEFSFVAPAGKYQNIQISSYSSLDSKLRIYIDDLVVYTKPGSVYKVIESEDGKVKELIYNGHQIIRQPE